MRSFVVQAIFGRIIRRWSIGPRRCRSAYDQIDSRPDDRIVISWDIALSEIESGDYSACVVLLIRKEIVYILEVVRGHFPFETLKKKVMELKRRYNPSTLLIEDSPISLGLIQSLREQSTTSRPISPTPTSALD